MKLEFNRMEISILFVALEDYVNKNKPKKNSLHWKILKYLGDIFNESLIDANRNMRHDKND